MYQIGQPILVPAVATDDQPGPVVFLAVTKKCDIATQNLQVPPAMQKKKKEKKKEKRKLSLMAIWVLILEKKLSAHCKYKNYTKQWVSYSENMCRVLGYDVLDHVYLMY